MKTYRFKCQLMSDVVLTSVSATEGFPPSLDYIPGTKFLGIVARAQYRALLDTNPSAALDLFHTGSVRFGDALPFIDGEKALRVPLSWQKAKGSDEGTIYLHHKLTDSIRQHLRSEGKPQLKQYREGYFTPSSNKLLTFNQTFSLKSKYDEKMRKSADGMMFGYYALRAGTEWVFDLEDDTGQYIDTIRRELEGKHHIGRSKSAEYGLICISFIGDIPEKTITPTGSSLLIYAESNLCFYDSGGRTTAQPTARQLTGLDKGVSINWEYSQVRSRNYQTWNTKRDNKDADRIIIERGSVLHVTLSDNQVLDLDFFRHGIGAHRAEGFGKVLVNPAFLQSDTHVLMNTYSKPKPPAKVQLPGAVSSAPADAATLAAIGQRYLRSRFPSRVERDVQTFIAQHGATFKGLTNSQWGTLRNYAKNLPNYAAFHTLVFRSAKGEEGFMYRGVSEKEWDKKNRRSILEQYVETLPTESRLPFLIRLCNQMTKQPTNELSD